MLSKFCVKPKLTHLCIKILKYLILTKNKMKFIKENRLKLVRMVDSDFANNKIGRKSITGYVLFLNNNPFV